MDGPPVDLRANRPSRRFAALVALLVAASLWISFQYLEPLPPRRLTIVSGPPHSLLHQHAEKYRVALEREGVELLERTTEGAGENLRLLADRASGIDIAFLQGGQAAAPQNG
jgi:hypothetical protein